MKGIDMTPKELRELLQKASDLPWIDRFANDIENPEPYIMFGDDTKFALIMVNLAPKLITLWEAAEGFALYKDNLCATYVWEAVEDLKHD